MDAGPLCGPSAHWVGDACLVSACSEASLGDGCELADAGVGSCHGGQCRAFIASTDPANCGGFGYACPGGYLCRSGVCVGDAGVLGGCPADCANGTACTVIDGSRFACVATSCGPATADRPCATGQGITSTTLCCGSSCIDLDRDPSNCGSCGNTCSTSQVCHQGQCVSTDCSTRSQGVCGLVDGGGELGECCRGTCSALASNGDCGACGAGCPLGQVCGSGGCALPDGGNASDCRAVGCGPGATCDEVMAFGQVAAACVANSCTIDGLACSAQPDGGFGIAGLCCGGACVDPFADPQNCGACGQACTAGAACSAGVCQRLVTCGGGARGLCELDGGALGECCQSSCHALASDPTNCGACGLECPTGSTCESGACSATCPVSLCPSGSSCVTGLSGQQPARCLSVSCEDGPDASPCARTDDGGTSPGTCCGGECVDLATDAANCGACGEFCATGGTCSGQCSGADAGVCQCPQGSRCIGSATSCVGGCTGRSDGQTCAFGPSRDGICCAGACVDPLVDSSNCGSCGTPCGGTCLGGGCLASSDDCAQSCAPGTECFRGRCVGSLCTAGQTVCVALDGALGECCGDACPDVTADPSNCGGCGRACPPGVACIQGECAGECTAATFDGFCDAGAGQGVCCTQGCTDILTDSANCGDCGAACPGGQTCDAGRCG